MLVLPVALSLLRYLQHELLGHRFPVLDVPRLFGCVFGPIVTLSANFADIAMGILLAYKTSQPSSIWNSLEVNIGIPYFSIAVSLNVILTLMIVARLVLHGRNFRDAMGTPARASGLYKAIITILIESSAIYAVTSLLFIGPWIAKNRASDIFLPILAEVQVRHFFFYAESPDRAWGTVI
jgi:hypothetical protein